MRFANLLAEDWVTENRASPRKPKAADTPLRNSDAGDCSRKLVYDIRGYEPEPFDEAGVWVTKLGERIHALWQAALVAQYPDAEVEYVVANDVTSGHLDAFVVLTNEGHWRIALELKTVNGTAFRRAVGAPSGRGTAEAYGPRTGDTIQLALNAHMAKADEARLCYLAMEAVGKGKDGFDGYDRFCAEWTWGREGFTPIAERELARFERIIADAAKPGVPFPEYEQKIISPPGELTFPCGYCGHQARCLRDSQ